MRAIKLCFFIYAIVLFSCSSGEFSTDTGKGGSMARFTIVGNYLYIVDFEHLHTYDVKDKNNALKIGVKEVGEGIETIYPFKGKLFIGSANGMYVYSIGYNGMPEYLSDIVHIMSCDPVVADDRYAYVTLRGSGNCRFGAPADLLEIMDIRDVRNLKKVASHPVPEPYGLSIDDNILFICHGQFGLGIYDISNPKELKKIKMIENVHSFDVINDNKLLLVVGKSGFYQYDYSDINNIELLSTIPVGI